MYSPQDQCGARKRDSLLRVSPFVQLRPPLTSFFSRLIRWFFLKKKTSYTKTAQKSNATTSNQLVSQRADKIEKKEGPPTDDKGESTHSPVSTRVRICRIISKTMVSWPTILLQYFITIFLKQQIDWDWEGTDLCGSCCTRTNAHISLPLPCRHVATIVLVPIHCGVCWLSESTPAEVLDFLLMSSYGSTKDA